MLINFHLKMHSFRDLLQGKNKKQKKANYLLVNGNDEEKLDSIFIMREETGLYMEIKNPTDEDIKNAKANNWDYFERQRGVAESK